MTKLQQLFIALVDKQLQATRDTDRQLLKEYTNRVLVLIEKEAAE